MKILLLRVIFWSNLIGSYLFAIIPQKMAPHVGELSDKWTHILAFTVLILLLRLAYKVTALRGFILLIGYGIWIELSQYFTFDRSSEWLDIVADGAGIGVGLLLYRVMIEINRLRS